ncbi:MAG: TIGR00180 family glycosyltransferase [Chitinophagaceae bacterium]|nr:TIGR00180 family glycosyltransferase [Chitinophagaceae bacterium]
MIDKLTLLIPTHNRHGYLSRSLAYYSKWNIHIIVADSTPEPFEQLSLYPKIEYLHFPGSSYSAKLPSSLLHVKTPYIVMCADDDFIVTNTLLKCFDFLENNADYSVAMGSVIYFSLISNDTKVELAPVYKGQLEYHISEEDPFNRVHTFFSNYRTVYYGLHRTDVLKTAFLNTENTQNLLLYEYISGLYPLIAGKVMAFADLYQVREYIGIPQAGITNIDKIFTEQNIRNEYENLLDQQSAVIAQKTGKEKKIIRSNLNSALEKYARHFILPFHLYVKSRLKLWMVWFLLSDKLNFFPFNFIKSHVNKYRLKKIVSYNDNKEQLSKIIQFILEYYRKKQSTKL